MSKELTERFGSDCLDCGFYYASIPDEGVIILRSSDRHYLETSNGDKIDILSVVPSYDEYSQMIKKIEVMKEQLMEANGIIKGASHLTVKDKRHAIICELISPEINDYLKKWGVK